MTTPQIYAKLVSMYLYDNFGEQIRFKEIFSRGKDTMLSDTHYDLIKQCNNFIEELDKRLICHDGKIGEVSYVKHVTEDLKQFGTWNSNGSYTPNNPRQIVGVFVDHFGLIKPQNRTKKDEIDAISGDSVIFRNKCKIVSPIHISQFNRSSGSDERRKQGVQDPDQTDFKDSGNLYDDSQIVFALFSPQKFKLNNYHDYDIKKLGGIFLGMFLLKSRFGNSDICVPLGFYGDCSHYLELPKALEINDYDKYLTPYFLTLKDTDKNEIPVDNNNNNETFKFIM